MADETTTTRYLIDTDLGANGGCVRLRDVGEFEQWINREVEFWEWIRGTDIPPNLRFISQTFNGAFQEAKTIVNQASSVPPENTQQKIASFVSKYEKGNLIHSSNPEAQFVADLHSNVGIVEAIAAVRMLLNKVPTPPKQPMDVSDHRVWHGIVALVLFREGISKRAAVSNRKAIERIAHEYSLRLSDDGVAADQLKSRLDALVSEHQTICDRGRGVMAKAVKLARKKAEQQRADVHVKMEELKNLYSAILGLEAPVKYWNDKSIKHQKWMKGLFIALSVYIATIVVAVGLLLSFTVFNDPAFWKNAGLELVGLTLAILGMLAAVARILYKLAASQLHLYNDADERGTMVQVYLALREGKHADESHMAIVLERLFAPGSDGVVRDDFIVTLPDALKAAVTKR